MNSKPVSYSIVKRPLMGVLLFIGFILIQACSRPEPSSHFQGLVMGTSWSAVISDPIEDHQLVEETIQGALDRIDRLMSNWKDDSDVSRFNRASINQPISVSTETLLVLDTSMRIHQATQGRFDPTLGPLIKLWGFSREEQKGFPDHDLIQAALGKLGLEDIQHDSQAMWKTKPGISLNFSAIAKGYGVDAAYQALQDLGFKHFLVEVGGEVRVRGKKDKAHLWRVGIETPEYGATVTRHIFAIAELQEQAMATSGDYRNYFEHDGKRYSHIIDPRFGYPVDTPIASTTVLAPDCMTADAYATSFMILSPQESLEICNRDPNLYCLIVERDTGTAHYSEGMQAFIVKP